MNIKQLVQQDVQERTPQERTYFKVRKLKVLFGKGLLVYATLPLMSFWAIVPGMMLVGIRPSLWARDKLRWHKQGRQFKW